MKKHNIIFPSLPSKGGPGSFQIRLTNELKKSEKINVISVNNKSFNADTILVVNGTKRLFWLFINKFKGVQIIHRIDGINTNYNFKDNTPKGLLLKLIRTFLVIFIANFLADKLIFQSNYIKKTFSKYVIFNKNYKVIYNGIEIKNSNELNDKNIEIVCVEGELNDDFSVQILNSISDLKINYIGSIKKKIFKNIINKNIIYHGFISRKAVLKILLNSKLYLSLEKNPPCPNSVIEALSLGIPVVGFDTGSLKELVGDAGVIVKLYNTGNNISKKSINELNEAISFVLKNYHSFSLKAKNRSKIDFNISKITHEYSSYILK